MKNLKLIVLMLLVINLANAQTRYGTGTGTGGGNASSYFGQYAGENATGGLNTFVGSQAGRKCTGRGNLAFGNVTLSDNIAGDSNIAIGNNAAKSSQGSYNLSIGDSAGKDTGDGNANINLGYQAGFFAGTNNVFIGFKSGFKNTMNVNNKLYIDSHYHELGPNDPIIATQPSMDTPLIYGDFATHQVGIGTNDVGDYALAVKGHIVAEEITVKTYDTNTGWADYVFDEDYDLMPLTELEKEIEKLGHLPEVPSAEEVNENGYKVGEMDVTLLKKVEELTLHLIEMDKAIKALQQSEKELNEENAALKTELSTSTEQKRTPRKKRGTKK